jgi:hypothetical protein
VNQEFKQCLENKKLVSFARGKKLIKKELSVARSDLSDAKAGYGKRALQVVNYSGLLRDVSCC